MSTNKHQIFITFVTLFLLTNMAAITADEDYINRKSYSTISVENGIYVVSFSAISCKLILGVIANNKYNDLNKLSYSVPSTFTVVERETHSANVYGYSISDSSYFVLFNNSTSCYCTFTSKVESDNSILSGNHFNLPYGITKTFTNNFNYQTLVIKSQSNSTIVVSSASSYSISIPNSTPTPTNFATNTINAYGTRSVRLNTYAGHTAYIYLNCRTLSGCPVFLSTEYSRDDSGSPLIIAAIIGPILFVAIFTFIVVLTIVISILVFRRVSSFLLAATTSARNTTTQPNNVSVQTVDTTEQIEVFVPQNTSAPQVYVIQPGIQQPHIKDYHLKPTYQEQNSYYNPGVGVYLTNETIQQEPMPGLDN